MVLLVGNSVHYGEIPKHFLELFGDEIVISDVENLNTISNKGDLILIASDLNPSRVIKISKDKLIGHIVQLGGDNFTDELFLAAKMIAMKTFFYRDGILAILKDLHFDVYRIDNYEEFFFSKRSDKNEVMQKMEYYISLLPKKNSVISEARLVIDELFTNAIFNAPVAEEFDRVIQNRSPDVNIEFSEGKKAQIRIAHNKNFLFIECQDPYGSLFPLEIISKIHRSFEIGLGQAINMRSGGAGIGSRLVYDASVSCHYAVDQGEKSTILSILPYGMGVRKREKLPKSFNVLYSGGLMSDLKYTEQVDGDKLIIKFSGSINEDAVLNGIDLSGSSLVEFDFENISGINSCGIREWIKWLKGIPEGTKQVWLNCPSEIVEQINMVEGFLHADARVESFYVPYYCDECDNKMNILMEIDPASKTLPKCDEEKDCNNCNSKAELDIIEAKYFKFLESKV